MRFNTIIIVILIIFVHRLIRATQWPGATVSEKLALLQNAFPADELARLEQHCQTQWRRRHAELREAEANAARHNNKFVYGFAKPERRSQMRAADAFFTRMRQEYGARGYASVYRAYVLPWEECAQACTALTQHWECVLGGILKLEALIVHGHLELEQGTQDANHLMDRMEEALADNAPALRRLQQHSMNAQMHARVRHALDTLCTLSLTVRARMDNNGDTQHGADSGGEEWTEIDLN